MKRIFLIIFLLSPVLLYSQIRKVGSKDVYVDVFNTTHLIFPTDIKYFSSIEDIIICAKTEAQNVLSIKAAADGWKSKTTLSVATADGVFHSFDVYYRSNNRQTSYYIQGDSTGRSIPLKVNTMNDLHLLFSSAVKYIDYGSNSIEAVPAPNVQNVVRVSTREAFEHTTNISVLTADRQFFTFALTYDDNEQGNTYIVGESPTDKTAILAREDLSDNSKEDIIMRLQKHGAKIYDLGVKKNAIEFGIRNVFVFDNKLIFRFNLKNYSHIKYDIDYMRFYIVDKKQLKESAEQEEILDPLFLDNFQPVLAGKEDNTYSVCFEKFTIPDKKYFIIEINEKGGGRHIVYKVTNRVIENAKPL